jgi:hypothetical protein
LHHRCASVYIRVQRLSEKLTNLDLVELAIHRRLAPAAAEPSFNTLPLLLLLRLGMAPQRLAEARQWSVELARRAEAQSPPCTGVAERATQLAARIDALMGKRRSDSSPLTSPHGPGRNP